MSELDTIQINDVEYVRADQVSGPNMSAVHVLIRSVDAGVFVGELYGRDGTEVALRNSRRIWYWDGAASLSELAVRGTSKPDTCKFPGPVPDITVLGVCEVIPMTAEAVESIYAVAEWTEQ